jgi:hypothetical protein
MTDPHKKIDLEFKESHLKDNTDDMHKSKSTTDSKTVNTKSKDLSESKNEFIKDLVKEKKDNDSKCCLIF